MEKRMPEFSTDAALAEAEYQERLLRALTSEMARLRRESGAAARNCACSLSPKNGDPAGAANLLHDRAQKEASCD